MFFVFSWAVGGVSEVGLAWFRMLSVCCSFLHFRFLFYGYFYLLCFGASVIALILDFLFYFLILIMDNSIFISFKI